MDIQRVIRDILDADGKYPKRCAPNPLLATTGMLYGLPMLTSLHANAWYAAVASANLMVSSVLYHSTKDMYYFWVDQIAIYCYVVIGVYEVLFRKSMYHHILLCMLGVYTAYLYPFHVMNEEYTTSTYHHAAMHAITAGVGALIFLV
jgi:hypothetical protein